MQPLIPLDEARARLLDQLKVSAAVESVALDDANGRILAEDLVAQMNVPPKANSEMDGYALCEQEEIGKEGAGNAWYCVAMSAHDAYGETPLIAAMRCLVASKLGDEIEVPEGLHA